MFKSNPLRRASSLVVLSLALGAAVGPAAASQVGSTTPPPDALFEAYLLNIDHGYSPDAYFTQGTFTGHALGAETVTLSPTNAPSVSVFVGGDDGRFEAAGRITYFGTVAAPVRAPDIPIPIGVAYSAHASGFERGEAYDGRELGQLTVGGDCLSTSCNLSFDADSTGLYSSPSFGQSGTLRIQVREAQVFQVQLYADARFDCHLCQAPGHTGSGQGQMFIDPVFTIDPDFLTMHPGYTLSFSAGIGNSASAAPEPADWALMIGGLGLLGAELRRRRLRSPSETVTQL
jgi:hypothetical protein